MSPASAGGAALPAVTYGYDAATGLPTTTSTASGGTTTALSTGYDDLGQATSYTDATGNVSHAGYDVDGRLSWLDDGKATTSYTYDSATEHRGLITSEDVGDTAAPSTFTATYNAAGELFTETYPDGLVATSNYDNAGEHLWLGYLMNGNPWVQSMQEFNAQGQVSEQSSEQSSQQFSYDGSDRLTTVRDYTTDGTTADCATRVYSFDADSNRTQLAAYPGASGAGGPTSGCTTATTPATTSYTYDQADRLTSDTAGGYAYDLLGRATTIPAGDANGIGAHASTTGTTSLDYYANDMAHTETQDTTTDTFTLDPDQNRIATTNETTTPDSPDGSGGSTTTTTDHYSDDTDSPTWTTTDTTTDSPTTDTVTWTRLITGIDGALAATQAQDGTIELQLANLHGDITATTPDTTTATSTDSYTETTEYGTPRTPTTAPTTYGWHGTTQRSTNDLAGLTLMGARLYNPTTGRFPTTDPIPGGNANPYNYPDDPINESDLTGQRLCIAWH